MSVYQDLKIWITKTDNMTAIDLAVYLIIYYYLVALKRFIYESK